MPYHQNRHAQNTLKPRTVVLTAARQDRPMVGLRDTLEWVAGWPDAAHLVIAAATAALSLVAADTGAASVQMTISAGLFVMGARIYSRFAR